MTDRKTPPEFREIENIRMLEPVTVILDNNIPLYVINEGTQELVKIEFLFFAGKWYEKIKGVASTTNSLINEGTPKRTATEIAEYIDYYGAFLETDCNGDTASITIFTLTRYLEEVLSMVKELLSEASFPENEIALYKQNHKQKIIVNNERVDYIARKKFNELLFGATHPYGASLEPEDLDAFGHQDLHVHYNEFYKTEDCRIIASGKIDDHITKLINRYFGFSDWDKPMDFISSSHTAQPHPDKIHFIQKENAVQSAIRIGRPFVTRTHKDFIPMQVLNTVLGGYFGSRLMSNIREDKGYTYGIGSGVGSLLHEGYFLIATEVGVKVCQPALDEIYKEIEILKNQPVGKEELDLVRNYMIGSFLRGIDGPFELAEKFKNVMLFGLDYSYYQKYLHTLRSIKTEDIMELANRYLKKEDLYELVVGEK